MIYATEDYIHAKFCEAFPIEYKRIIDKCFDVIYSWPEELHDTKEVSSKVLEALGEHWITKLEELFPEYDDRFDEHYTVVEGWNLYLHKRGRDLTRQLKFIIKRILDAIYEKNPEFKYLKKHNPQNRHYTVWKNSKFNSAPKKSANKTVNSGTSSRGLSLDQLKAYIEDYYEGELIVEFRDNKEEGQFFNKVYKLVSVNNHPTLKYKLWLNAASFKYANTHIADLVIDHFSADDIHAQYADKELDEFFDRSGRYSGLKVIETQDHIKDTLNLLRYGQLKLVESIVNFLVADPDDENLNYLINKLGTRWYRQP